MGARAFVFDGFLRRRRRRVPLLLEVVGEAVLEVCLVHILEKDLGEVALLTRLLLEPLDGAVDGGDCVPDVGEVLNLALEGGVPGEIAPYFLEFVRVRGVAEEFLDAKGSDGNVDQGSGARERRHV